MLLIPEPIARRSKLIGKVRLLKLATKSFRYKSREI
jgi:hypothetical protein